MDSQEKEAGDAASEDLPKLSPPPKKKMIEPELVLVSSSSEPSGPKSHPVVRDLSKVCKNFLALEEENRRLSMQLEDVCRIVTQATADKTSLKAQLDDLAAEKSVLTVKADGLAEEVARLKAELTKAQELATQRRLEPESKDK